MVIWFRIYILVNDENIMSIADDAVIKISKEDFIKKHIRTIKEPLMSKI
ncbi:MULTISPECIES: hypothetical protein [unclassified Clostridium]|nr:MULTISPECIES: hypothetical protein [unclassified Clostridium]